MAPSFRELGYTHLVFTPELEVKCLYTVRGWSKNPDSRDA